VGKLLGISRSIVVAAIIVIVVVGALGYYYYYRATQPPAPQATVPATPGAETPVTTPFQTPSPQQITTPILTIKTLRIGTTEAGSVGYVVGSIVADMIRKLYPELDISTYPIGGFPINIREFAANNIEMAYVGLAALSLAWERKPPFDTLPKEAKLPVHTLYLFTAIYCLATTPDLRDKGIKSWEDLDGKKVSIFTSGWIRHRLIMKALETIGVKAEHVEMGLYGVQGDALRKGDVVAIGIHGHAGIPAPGASEILAKMDLIIINPSKENAEKVVKAGLPFAWFPVSAINWGKPMGVDEMFCLTDISGWHTTPDILPEEAVYRLLKYMIENREELAKMNPYFKEFAKDPIGIQVLTISVAPHVPVHPGLAKLLKEYGVWNPEWKIAGG